MVGGASDVLLRLEQAGRSFHMGDVEVAALADVDLKIERGEFLVVLGPSGSGKSTLLNLMGGTDRATSGRVYYEDTDLTTLPDSALTDYRRSVVGFIFQFYNLVPTLTAGENVAVAADLIDDPVPPREALELVGLVDRIGHFPSQLSGGEQQRVSIARALAKKPSLVLADEPTGALDVEGARTVLGILQDLNRRKNLTIVLITHNSALAGIAHRMVRLVGGRITEERVNDEPIEACHVTW